MASLEDVTGLCAHIVRSCCAHQFQELIYVFYGFCTDIILLYLFSCNLTFDHILIF